MRVITQDANGFQTSIQRTAGDEWRFVVTPATREHEARAAEPTRDGGRTLWRETVMTRMSRAALADNGYGPAVWRSDSNTAVY